MKKVFTLAAALAFTAVTASAQVAVDGTPTGNTSGNPDYPTEVRGNDGNLYNCSIDIVAKNGTPVRRCVAADGGTFTGGGLGGLATVGILLAVGGVAAAISNSDNDDNSANGSN